MSFGEKIRTLRKEKNVSQIDLASYAGLSQASLSKLERGDTEKLDIFVATKMAECLDVTTDFLLGIAENSTPPLPRNAIPIGSMGMLPVLGSVGAGNGVLAVEDILDYSSADEKYDAENHFYLQVKGDSMSPLLQNGDLVLVRKQKSVDSGDIAVVVVDDEEGVVKDVFYDADWIELRSRNPLHATRRFNGEEVMRVYVVGVVLESKRKLK